MVPGVLRERLLEYKGESTAEMCHFSTLRRGACPANGHVVESTRKHEESAVSTTSRLRDTYEALSLTALSLTICTNILDSGHKQYIVTTISGGGHLLLFLWFRIFLNAHSRLLQVSSIMVAQISYCAVI